MTKKKLLDSYSNAGGAGMGYHRAGFEVVGVDIEPMPRYPFEFHQADALEFLAEHGHEFDAIHASPPCQAWTRAQRIRDNVHPDLVAPTRELLEALGKPWVIENVVDAPLKNPIMLCGAMFPGLGVYRHRLFESNFPIEVPQYTGSLPVDVCGWPHVAPLRKMGRPPQPGDFMHVVGNFSGVAAARIAMGINWMVRDELREAIPPAYTQYVGAALLMELNR